MCYFEILDSRQFCAAPYAGQAIQSNTDNGVELRESPNPHLSGDARRQTNYYAAAYSEYYQPVSARLANEKLFLGGGFTICSYSRIARWVVETQRHHTFHTYI